MQSMDSAALSRIPSSAQSTSGALAAAHPTPPTGVHGFESLPSYRHLRTLLLLRACSMDRHA